MDEVKYWIKELKSEHGWARVIAAQMLGEIGDVSAVPTLVGALKVEDVLVRMTVAGALERMIEKCKTTEELQEIDAGIAKGFVALRKEKDRDVRINTQIELARLTRKITEKKDELAPKRDLLLDDKPKPPKKGRGTYQALRKCRY